MSFDAESATKFYGPPLVEARGTSGFSGQLPGETATLKATSIFWSN
jgi:hypothetical protein